MREVGGIVRPDWDELHVGAALDRVEAGPITRTDIVRFAGASGDFHPLHHDDPLARTSGYPGVFSHGLLQASMLGAHLTSVLGAENVRRFAVQFREQVWPGDHLAFEAHVVRRYEEVGERRIDLEVAAIRVESGAPAVSGTATFVVPR